MNKPLTGRGTSHAHVVQDDLELVTELLDEVSGTFYTIPISCAKRLAIGGRLRGLSDNVMGSLTTRQKNILTQLHDTHRPMIPYMVHRRGIEKSMDIKPEHMTYAQLAVESDRYNANLETNNVKHQSD